MVRARLAPAAGTGRPGAWGVWEPLPQLPAETDGSFGKFRETQQVLCDSSRCSRSLWKWGSWADELGTGSSRHWGSGSQTPGPPPALGLPLSRGALVTRHLAAGDAPGGGRAPVKARPLPEEREAWHRARL